MLLQEFFFKDALKEAKIDIKNPYKIIHSNGKNINNGVEYPIIFSNKRINLIENIQKKCKKTTKYFFQGLLTDNKKWILEFNNKNNSKIIFSNRGRNPNLKYIIDEDYFTNMSSSKFTLCPTDVYSWSYRFFEAIMCKSIPILNDDEKDIFSHNFKFYRKSDKHVYNEDWVRYNIIKLKTYHTISFCK